jgi:hypothetical protein
MKTTISIKSAKRLPDRFPSPGTQGEGQHEGLLRDKRECVIATAYGAKPSPQPSPGVPGEGVKTSRVAAFGLLIAAVMAVSFFAAPVARAQAQVAREVIESAAEKIFQQAGKQGLRELTEMGGKAAVRDVLEQSAREGGETLVRRVTQYGIEDGPAALRAIGLAPAKMVESLDGLTPELRGAALRAVERDPQALLPLVQRHGAAALEVACRQPGVGEVLVARLGDDGITLGRKLTTDQSILAARHADEIAALAPTARSAIVRKIAASPARVLGFLEGHPRVLLTSAGVATVLALKDQIIGDGGGTTVLPDGRVISRGAHPGLIERLLPPSLAFLSTPFTVLVSVVAAGVAGWFAMQLFASWKLHRLRHLAAAAQLTLRGGK